MGTTKQRKPGRRGPIAIPSSAEFTVVLEDLRGNFAVFGEALRGLAEMTERRFDEVDHRFDQVEGDLAAVKGDVALLKSDLAVVKSDLAVVKSDLAVVKSDLAVAKSDLAVVTSDVAVVKGDVALLKSAVLDEARQTKALCASVDELADKIEKKPDRDEVAALVRQVVNGRAH